MPFVVVQLANYDGRQQTGMPRPITYQEAPVNSGWAQLREAQRTAAKADSYTELVVINDLGETVDIHPLRKKEVAERIGLCFDRLVYNDKKVSLYPEVIDSQLTMDNGQCKIALTLDQPVVSGTLYEFEVAGEDGKFVNAEATADGNRITILSPLTSDHSPQKVRYAWKDNPLKANVRSFTGLPMSSFELEVSE